MQNRFSVKSVGVLVIVICTLGISFINFTFALKCYECEDEACDVGPVIIRKCEHETSVCMLFKDVTGRALQQGPRHIYKRSCGVATYPNNKTEWNCTQYTANFDRCLCREDLCNGDESLMQLTTTTLLPPPSTTESEESGSEEARKRKLPTMFKGRDFGDDIDNSEYPDYQQGQGQGQKMEGKKCNHKPGNGQGMPYNDPHYSNQQDNQQGGNLNYRNNQQGRYSNREEDYYGEAGEPGEYQY